MDKPSEWAVKQARDMLQGPFNAANAEDDAPLHAAVAAALTAAHEAGREEMSKAIEDLMTRYLGVPAEFGWEARFVQAAIEVKRAHEAGRKAGLEEAARVCESRGSHLPDIDQRLEHERTARAIRAAGEVRGG